MPPGGSFHGGSAPALPSPVVPRVKGSTLRTRKDFVERYHGPRAWQRVRDALSEEDRAAWAGVVQAGAWYPFEACTRLERAIVDGCAEGDERICVDIGAYSAAENLATLYRAFLADAEDPFEFYRRFERLYPTLYDFGSMAVARVVAREELHVVLDFAGFATRTNCLATLGFFRGAGVSVAIPRVRVEERWCQARGNSSCLVVVQWGEAGRKRR
jgi:predicted hydrocarbon binding protein